MNFFASAQKSEGRETLENMEGEEERGIVGEENSQKDAAADETSRKKERSQTPQLGSVGVSDADDDKEEDREEQTTGSLWGHTRLTPSVANVWFITCLRGIRDSMYLIANVSSRR